MRSSPLFVGSVEKAFRILEAFGPEPTPVSVAELSERARLDKSAVQRFVHTLIALGYLHKDPQTRRLSLTARTLGIGFTYLRSDTMIEIAMRHMSTVGKQYGETVNCTVLDDTEVVYVARVPSRSVVRVHLMVGTRAPAYCTATGRAIVAFLPPSEREEILNRSNLVKHTSVTITDRSVILGELEKVQEDGVAVTGAECWEGAIAVAAPIFGPLQSPLAAVSISVPIVLWTIESAREKLGPVVKKLAETITFDICGDDLSPARRASRHLLHTG